MNEPSRAGGRPSTIPPSAALSPLVKPLPKGYRDIQPFRKGQGWHSNGKSKRAKPSPRQLREDDDSQYHSPDRVVFPAIQGYEYRLFADERLGPNVSAVEETSGSEQEGHDNSNDETKGAGRDGHLENTSQPSPRSEDPIVRVIFRPLTPQAACKVIAKPPSAPRRPSSVGCEPYGNTSFRARALSSSTSTICTGSSNNASSDSRPSSPLVSDVTSTSVEPRMKDVAVQSSLGDRTKHHAGPRSIAELITNEGAPDPALVQQLWQEFNERAQAQRVIDRDEYHRKMQRKYSERKALREQVARLERLLTDSRNEHANLLRQLDLEPTDDFAGDEEDAASAASPMPSPDQSPLSSPRLSPRAAIAVRNLQLERALKRTKQQLADTEELLNERETVMQNEIDHLKARLELESHANTTLARQLRETSSSLQLMGDELVDTRAKLEKEEKARQIDSTQSQEYIQRLLIQHRQDLVMNEAKQALRNLGRQALCDKVKAFHSRAIVAEQRMRVAQEEVLHLQHEASAKQRTIELLMSDQAVGTTSSLPTPDSTNLSADASERVREDEIVLFHGTKSIASRDFLLHAICDVGAQNARDDDESFRIQFAAFDPVSGQHDCLTFRMVDIKRLVVDSHKFLKRHEPGRRERLSELATRLASHIHAGFKAGRLVLCEIPSSQHCSSDITLTELPAIREVIVYKGTRLIECCCDQLPSTEPITAEVTLNEVFSTKSPEQWWIRIHAVLVDAFFLGGVESWDVQEDYVVEVDYQRIVALCTQFDGYRPTDQLAKLSSSADQDRSELMTVHESMLRPLMDSLRVFVSPDASSSGSALRLGFATDVMFSETAPTPSTTTPPIIEQEQLAVSDPEIVKADLAPSQHTAAISPTHTGLDHRCIVNMGGVFYCARFLELWDDELLLEITLDDPESSVRITGLLRERHLAAIAAHLYACGMVTNTFASELELGLPPDLKAPLCKLLTKHLRRSRVVHHSLLGVSFASLFREIGFIDDGTSAEGCAATPCERNSMSDTAPFEHSAATHSISQPLAPPEECRTACVTALGCSKVLSESQIQEFIRQIKLPKAYGLRQSRRGMRLRGENGGSELALLQIYDGFADFDGFVAAIFPWSALGKDDSTRLVVMSEPFGPHALKALEREQWGSENSKDACLN